jgi:hypothetical protein
MAPHPSKRLSSVLPQAGAESQHDLESNIHVLSKGKLAGANLADSARALAAFLRLLKEIDEEPPTDPQFPNTPPTTKPVAFRTARASNRRSKR